MRVRLPLIAVLLACLAPGAASAAPTIVTLELRGLPVAGGDPLAIVVAGEDPDGAVISATADGGDELSGQSACRINRRGQDAFGPGRKTTFSLPWAPSTPGVDIAQVTLGSGGCGGVEETTARALTITVTLPTLFGGRAAGAGCPGANDRPSDRDLTAGRTATLCLLNARRSAAGLKPLREDKRLRRAALRHSRDMVRRSFFDHQGPSGPSLVKRVSRVDYWPATVGENIGTGTGLAATPAQMVEAWMASDLHRQTMLARVYKTVGIGIAPTDTNGRSGGTFTADFGDR